MIYDFAVIGRWRNRDDVAKVRDAIRESGHTCYCFIDNDWSHHKTAKFDAENIETMMQSYEKLSNDSPELKEIFEKGMKGLKNSHAVVLALPGGTSSHIESGVAYGLGKPLYAVAGEGVEVKDLKSETLYQVFNKIFANLGEFKKFLKETK